MTTTTQSDSGTLDINSVMKASQTISSEIKLTSLLQKMMEVVIEMLALSEVSSL